MIKRIDHVAIVVDNLKQTLDLLSSVFGFEELEKFVDPLGNFTSTMVRSHQIQCELLEPTGDGGHIAKFLRERGGGLHHLSLEVDDLDQEIESLRKKGIPLLGTGPQTVGNDRLIFIHPRAMKGVLIELLQRGPSAKKED
jgi:methylmalonyl-CoA epimerase